MRKVWTPPWPWVFGAATAFGLFSFLQAYRLTLLNSKPGMTIDAGKLLILNLALWYLPAIMMPAIVSAARRFPLRSPAGASAPSPCIRPVRCSSRSRTWSACSACGFSSGTTAARTRRRRGPSTFSAGVFEQLDWSLMVYAVIVGVSHAVAYYHEAQERKLKAAHLETRLIEARLKTLEAELHPHFLFNTLHAISTLVHRDPESADRMISRLSDLLRITFDRSGEPKVSLKEEMDFLQKYLDIEQTRFQDRLTVHVNVEPDALDGEVPRMILQPLVENAIKHGIARP